MDVTPRPHAQLNFGVKAEPLPKSETVLLLVDVINPLQLPGDPAGDVAVEAGRRSAALKRKLASRGARAIYANDNYGVWRSEFHDVLDYCRRTGGAAGELAQVLAPQDDDITILKPRHSAFHATPLELLLQQMHTRDLIVVGLTTDVCVHLTAMEAYLRGFRIKVPRDCTAGSTPERKDAALALMEQALRVDTADSSAY